MSPLYVVSLVLLVLGAALAFWRGGVWERATAGLLAVVWVGSELTPFDGVSPSWTIIVLDGAVAVFLLYAAIFSDRKWTIWAAAFQLLLMANHLAFIRFPELQQWAYVTAYYLWADAVVLALAVGALTRKHRPNSTAKLEDDSHAGR